MIETICRDCIFATYDNGIGLEKDEVLTQRGCKLGRLDIFKEKNQAKLELNEDCNHEYYRISRFCNTCRDMEWGAMYFDPEKKILEHTQDQYDCVVVHTGEKTAVTIKSLINQTIKPHKIIVVVKDKTCSNFKQLLEDIKTVCLGYEKYEILRLLEDVAYDELIDSAVKKCTGLMYSIFSSNYVVPPNFIENIDREINGKLNHIAMILPRLFKSTGCLDYDEIRQSYILDNGLTVHVGIHNGLFGNIGESIQNKIIKLNTEQGNNFIKGWEEIHAA